ncbi:hypothetical protein K1719_032012 [Acacia pycnantha]|nr:hypothetical protein K1719_032012 [Acacia pycnantha]
MAKSSHDVVFSDRPSVTAAKGHFYGCNNDILFAPYGEGWKQKRRIIIEEFLASSKLRSFQFMLEEEFLGLVNEIREACMKKKNDNGLSSSISKYMFAAGVDTTATTMEWAMAELMKHPGKMKRAQEEVRGIVGDKARIDESDVNQMSYLKCVVKETLRLHPPGPLLAPRKTRSS